ncbi:MAG: hypothetical protein RLY37_1144, partial [Verrucomicrobiota bacterium]
MRQGFGVNLLGEGEAGAAGFGEADDFFQPGRARGLHVDAGAMLSEGATDGRIDGELVATAVHGELQVGREAILLHRMGDDAEVVIELAFELGEVADVVYALVETTGELRSDRLDRHTFVGDGREDDEELGRGLGAVGLVHRDLGDEAADALHGDDVAVDLAGFLDGQQKLGGRALDVGARGSERTVDAGEGDRTDELRVAIDEGLDRGGIGGLGDEVGDIDSKEVGDADETLDGLQADVVGVEEVGGGPAEGLHGGVGRGAGAGRLGADDVVLAVGLVPDRDDFDAELLGGDAGGELGFGFVGEAVAHAEGEFTDDERLGGHVGTSKGGQSRALLQTLATTRRYEIRHPLSSLLLALRTAVHLYSPLSPMHLKIAVLPGDYIGPEVMAVALPVLEAVLKKSGHTLAHSTHDVGGAGIDNHGKALPDSTLEACRAADAILFGSVGGPKWEKLPPAEQPERASLLPLRKHFTLYANVRPGLLLKNLIDTSPIRPDRIPNGVDMVCIRELTGGLYFGPKSTTTLADGDIEAIDTMVYRKSEIERITDVAIATARG